MTKRNTGKLNQGCPDLPSTCDVCRRHRSVGKHYRCSRIRQERHAQILRNEEFDRLLMHDLNDKDFLRMVCEEPCEQRKPSDDQTIPIPRVDEDAERR